VKVWVDLSNSPHPLLFAPVARRLTDAGHRVLFTARDNAQTVALARERWPDSDVIGSESPRGKRAKATALATRVNELRRWARRRRPDVALSHNSYAQIVAARSLRIPTVTAMDYEHQPANHLAFRLATTVILPQAMSLRAARLQGATRSKVVVYEGLKEELYIGDFEPDTGVLRQLGMARRPHVLVVARTPPARAIYHQFGNPMFARALEIACADQAVTCVVLARHAEQREAVARLQLSNCIVPADAIDSRSLIYASDLMIGAGGTMTREAALMGIPTWTVFAGRTPAVDAWLEHRGMLSRLAHPEQLARLTPRLSPPLAPDALRASQARIEQVFVDAVLSACR
jgi:predicted glycosyltransferase